MKTLLISVFSLLSLASATTPNDLPISAPSGTYQGFIHPTTPEVRQFLGIPFAKPPTGSLRWSPPEAFPSSTTTFNATQYSNICPQYIPPSAQSIFTEFLPEFQNDATIDEDCLRLSIWTPTNAKQGSLPVIVFLPGGGFQQGGSGGSFQDPYHWIQRTQKHIVVTINYRLNIFGFPNAAGLEEQNLGILDQRLGLEWVRDNIGAFGGDSERITLYGQSAGASSADYHAFAYSSDPIFKSMILQSGTAFLYEVLSFPDPDQTNFTFVASQLGCDDSSTELDCLRSLPWQSITNFLGQYAENGTMPALTFFPVPDERVIFSNYTQRYEQGKLSSAPAILTTTTNEGISAGSVPFNPNGPENQTLVDQATASLFTCPASRAAELRTQAGLKTYRGLYAGNWTNLSPRPWLGAWHGSDIPMVLGSHQDAARESTMAEFRTSEVMQDLILQFAENLEGGLDGWEEVSSGEILEFGRDGVPKQTVRAEDIDAVCE